MNALSSRVGLFHFFEVRRRQKALGDYNIYNNGKNVIYFFLGELAETLLAPARRLLHHLHILICTAGPCPVLAYAAY